MQSVSLYSSHLARLREDKQQINECSSSVNNVISEQILVIVTSRLFILYAIGLFLFTVSLNIIYGSPVSILDLRTLVHLSIDDWSLISNFFIKSSPTTTHWCKLRHCLLGSPLGLLISKNSSISSCSISRLTEAAPLLTFPWLVAIIAES